MSERVISRGPRSSTLSRNKCIRCSSRLLYLCMYTRRWLRAVAFELGEHVKPSVPDNVMAVSDYGRPQLQPAPGRRATL
ncbi:hypothetical protein EVAR_15793_1 [Eumeta japonica]|uniref:Uncharacterized protein n=1 Tax=Eumeta variegata TaxID=151549 RepID=A0A4C1TZF1_EUMVA|nr:hypothetical protein EVAR_15793_1 [Eumeta japonica]